MHIQLKIEVYLDYQLSCDYTLFLMRFHWQQLCTIEVDKATRRQ